MLQPAADFVIFDEFPAVGLLDSPANGYTEEFRAH